LPRFYFHLLCFTWLDAMASQFMHMRQSTTQKALQFALAMLVVSGACAPLEAWVTIEHIDIGAAYYKEACEYFRNPDIVRSAAQRQRADLACSPAEKMARYYGELTAYGGDYAAKPEAIPMDLEVMSKRLEDLSNWKKVKNLLHRALLALKDGKHFQPYAQEQWRLYHRRALELATQARQEGSDDQKFRHALVTNAFADHFLQDAFSAGHNGTDRETTIPSLQKVYHDAFCCWGRFLGDGYGNTWFTLGDGGLDKPCNKEGRARMHHAGIESVRNFLWQFIMDQGSYSTTEDIFKYMPKRYADQKYRVIPAEYDKELCPSPDIPIIRYKNRYLKCSDPDFFEFYVDEQLGRSAAMRTAEH
jgi:hypothetical protein